MSTLRRRNSRRCRRMAYTVRHEESNPMESLLNLSDIMLVLAVGIMLALVLHWNVPLGQTGNGTGNGSGGISQSAGTDNRDSPNQTAGEISNPVPDAVSLNRDDLSETGRIPEGSRKVGNVYYDEKTGNYYILQE